jgi:hypothetical protein
MLLLGELLKIDLQWRSSAISGMPAETQFLPFARTVPDMAIGVTDSGLWALSRFDFDIDRPGRLFDPTSTQGLIFLCPLLQWVPRMVMDEVNVVALSAGVQFVDLWEEFPWRYVVRSAIQTNRVQWVALALDWLTYLGVAGEFETELRSIGLSVGDLALPRPRLEDFEIE